MNKADIIREMIKKSTGFDALTKDVKYLSTEDGNCTAELKVEKEHINLYGGLHGGFSATLVDVVSSLALFTHKYGYKSSVSVNINITYMKGAVLGDELLIQAKTLKVGKNLAFLEVEIFNKNTKVLLLKGSHTKYFLNEMPQ